MTQRIGRFSMPLLARVVLALAVVGLAPFAITAFLLDRGREAMVDQTQKTHLAKAQAAAERVETYLELHDTLGKAAIRNASLYTDPGSDGAREVLTGLLEARPGEIVAAGVYVIDAEGAEMVQLAQLVELRDTVAQAMQLDDPRFLVATHIAEQFWLRLRVPFARDDLFLQLVIAPRVLASSFVTAELGDEAELVLVDREARVMAGNVNTLVGYPPDLLEKARSGNLQSGAAEYDLEGDAERVVSAYVDVGGSPWFVLSRQPSRVAERATARMRSTAWQAFGGTVLLMGLLAVGAQRTIVHPIRRLVTAQRRLAGIENETAAGGEIEQLEEAFELLERHLNDREALSKVFLGRYQVVEVLGVGAMGTVFRGFDPKLQRPVALKTIKISQVVSAEKRRDLATRLLKEAITLARLQHPHIVTVFDVIDQGEAAFIAMELVEGMSLETYRWQEDKLSISQTVCLGAAVLRGLAAAHQHGFVHHDVKPANILLGTNGSIKVADFGIAELLSKASEQRQSVFGTPGYVAPETLQGQGYTERSDLFAVGVVLYECLTGKRPFQGRNPKETMLRTVLGKYVPLANLCPDLPAGLEVFLKSLLAKNPDDRPADAVAAAEELETIAAHRAMRWTQPTKISNRQRMPRVTTQRAHASMLPTRHLDRV